MKFRLLSSASMIAFGGVLGVVSPFSSKQAIAVPVPITGSSPIQIGGVNPNGGIGDLMTATSFGLTSATWHAGTHASPRFNLIPINTPIADSTLTISSLASYSFSSSAGTFTAAQQLVVGSKSLSSEVVGSSGSIAAGTESLSIYLAGNFVPTGPLAAFAPDNASETISFTETGITNDTFGSFSVSATFASPASAAPATNTSEPPSMVLLGAGLVGLGALRRRRV